MKKIIILTIFAALLSILSTNTVFAQTKSTTPTPTPKGLKEEGIEQIQKIKDIVASKVAELNLVEKRGFVGTVVTTNTTQIIIKDSANLQRTIDIDDLTKFEGSDKETFGISDIKPGDKLLFLGLYNKETKHLLARQVKKSGNIPIIISAIVTSVSPEDFQLEIITENNTKMKVDVEKSTKTSSVSKDGTIEKSGFSKIKLHERILVTGFPDPTDTKTINAERLLHFLDMSPSVKMRLHAGIKEGSTIQPTKASN